MTHVFRASPVNASNPSELSERSAGAGGAGASQSRWSGRRLVTGLFLAVFAVLSGAVAPSTSRAAMPDANILFDYGFKGLTLGAEVGLAVGYLASGRYEEDDWRNLVLGAGIGALTGMTTGMIIATGYVTSGGGVPVGYFMLRDAGYGTWIGAAVGAMVGALLWVDDGQPRDVLQGAGYGTLFGAVSGMVYGIIEGNNASPSPHRYDYYSEWRFSVSPVQVARAPGIAATVAKHF